MRAGFYESVFFIDVCECVAKQTFENNQKLGTAQQLNVFEGFSVSLCGIRFIWLVLVEWEL